MSRAFFVFLTASVLAFAQYNQEKDIQMLNYVGSLSERIKDSRKNPYELHLLRDEIMNDVDVLGIKPITKHLLEKYQKNIVEFTLLSRQEERMQFIIDNKKAEAINQSIPDPQALIGLALSNPNPYLLVANVGTMIARSISSYKSAMASAEMEELKMKWELEDKRYKVFEKQSLEAWAYRVDVTNESDISKSLNEKVIQNFFKITKDDKKGRLLEELENSETAALYTGAHYQPYYLALAEAYYSNGNWEKCVQAYKEYEKNPVRLFTIDHSAAKVLLKVIDAGTKYLPDEEKIAFIKDYNNKLIKESSKDEWELRYFAGLNYMNLVSLDVTNRKIHLKEAFKIFRSNIAELSSRQDSLLAKFILPIDKNIPNDLSDEKKKIQKKLFKIEEKERKYKTLPLDKALLTNMEMAFAIAKLDKSLMNEWNEYILKRLLETSLTNMHLRKKYGLKIANFNEVTFNGKELELPISFVSDSIKIDLIVTYDSGKKYTFSNVKRKSITVNRPDDDDLFYDQSKNEFIDQLRDFKVILNLDINPYGIDFDKVPSVEFSMTAHDEEIRILLVKKKGEFKIPLIGKNIYVVNTKQ